MGSLRLTPAEVPTSNSLPRLSRDERHSYSMLYLLKQAWIVSGLNINKEYSCTPYYMKTPSALPFL